MAVLLDYSPKQKYVVSFIYLDGEHNTDYIGTYDEILNNLRGRIPRDSAKDASQIMFDYKGPLTETSKIKYLSIRTDNFNPDLTASFLKEIEKVKEELLCEIRNNGNNSKQHTNVKYSTKPVDEIISLLRGKCLRYRREGLIDASQFSMKKDSVKNSEQSTEKDKFAKLLRNVFEKLGDNYAIKETSGKRDWKYNGTGDSLAYIGMKLSEACGLKSIPWAVIKNIAKANCDTSYLKGEASRMKNGKKAYPTESQLIDDVIDEITKK